MTYAGFVLVGGRSSRMGRDKALLPYKSKTLVEHVAGQILGAAGNVTLIGDPASYGRVGYPVYADRIPECGPLGGIYTALSLMAADWNLIAGCDLPGINSAQLQRILAATDASVECVVPVLENGLTQPLCAAYHQCCLAKVETALQQKRLRVREFVATLSMRTLSHWSTGMFTNLNSPADWERIGE